MKNLIRFLILVLILPAIFVVACQPAPEGQRITTKTGHTIVVIESCEYIEVDEGIGQYRVYALTHKGNCKNPIHKTAKPEESVTFIK